MADKERNWLRDIFLIPLIVGLIIVTIQFIVPYFLQKDKEISYEIPSSTIFINKNDIKNVDIKLFVENKETKFISIMKAKVWNSGELPLKNIPISYVFNPTKDNSNDFQILSINHKTKPEYQFGKITQVRDSSVEKGFKYELLNPGDEIEISFITNAPAVLSIYTKAEGMKVKYVKESKPNDWFSLISLVIAILASFLSVLLKSFETIKSKLFYWFKKWIE